MLLNRITGVYGYVISGLIEIMWPLPDSNTILSTGSEAR